MVSSANSSYDDELKTNTCKSMSARKKVSTPSKTSYPYYILACVVMLCVGLGITYFFLQNNIASAQEYPVKGFDVSHHQGDIQWQSISPQEFKFVYLKATEGGDFKDRKFQDNWLKAREQGFLVGAYHFYRLCRDGQIQAQNFIETVPKKTDSLPPVIDLEYDSNCINTYTREQLLKEIQVEAWGRDLPTARLARLIAGDADALEEAVTPMEEDQGAVTVGEWRERVGREGA